VHFKFDEISCGKRYRCQSFVERNVRDFGYLDSLRRSICISCLGLPSLELRRLHLDLLYCYKIVFGLVCLDVNKYFTITATRGHQYKLYKAQCDNPKRHSFFTERIVNVWNSLPAKVDFSFHCPGSRNLSHKSTSRSS